MRLVALTLAALLLSSSPGISERPDTVFFEHLTFDEIRDLIKGGARNVILATGGTQDGGPLLTLGDHNDVVTYTADRIARELGNTLVAPVIPYGPGSISLLDDQAYSELLEAAATSLEASGFKNIIFIGDSAGTQAALKSTADRLNSEWKETGARVLYIGDYYVKSRTEADKYITEKFGTRPAESGDHAGLKETAEAMVLNAPRIRLDKLEGGGLTKPTPQLGQVFLRIKVDNAVAQIRQVLSASQGFQTPSRTSVQPAALSGGLSANSAPGLFLEDMTWSEVQDAIAAGKTLAIIPTGGTEKNGFHMTMGKHNFHVRKGAELMAQKLGNALIAPVLQYVPEAQASERTPGVLSCTAACFEHVVETIARNLSSEGFKDILLVGDNGGNQTGLRNVANRLNKEWENSDKKVFALTDYYDKGHEYLESWLLAQYGWDISIVGTHAGIQDTSQMLYVKPEDVRKDRITESFANKKESSVSGDPTKATEEFGRVALEFKSNAAIAQYRALKSPAQGGSRGNRGSAQ